MTDHSALPAMYNDTLRPAPHRVDRRRGRLGAFDMTVEYVPGEKMPCDYGSRHPKERIRPYTAQEKEDLGIEQEEEDKEVWINSIVEDHLLNAMSISQIREETKEQARKNIFSSSQPIIGQKNSSQI